MNIFILSKNPKKCAKYHCDKHVVKMILELGQMLCAAHIILDSITKINDQELYKLSHKNHPCTIWIRSNIINYRWSYELFKCLCHEYTYRYNKIHLCEKKFLNILDKEPVNIDKSEISLNFVTAMPDYCKIEGHPIRSYRNYYINEKKTFCKWYKRRTPSWFII